MIDAHVHLLPHIDVLNKSNADVNFTSNGVIRFSEGRAVQYMPTLCADGEFTTATLLKIMDDAGIEKSIILQSPLYGFLNDQSVNAVKAHPDRLTGAMQIHLDDNALDEMESLRERGLTCMKFELSEGGGYCKLYPNLKLDSDLFFKIWGKANELGVSVIIDPSPIGTKSYQVEALEKIIPVFPGVNFIICHLGFPYVGIHENPADYDRWQRMIALAANANVWFDISALSAFYAEEDYPFPSAEAILKEFTDQYGTEKAIWGSDIPGTLVFATYRQLINMFKRSEKFSDQDKEKIFKQNAMAAYRL